jgi:hypothetical protein
MNFHQLLLLAPLTFYIENTLEQRIHALTKETQKQITQKEPFSLHVNSTSKLNRIDGNINKKGNFVQ